MIYPLKVLQIETTNVCNSNCIFCVHNQLKSFGTMSGKLFKKILLDAKEIPTINLIIPMLLGEPFCDKKIIQRLRLINKIHPNKRIAIFTNGSLLTEKIINQLTSIKNLDMHFSLNGATRETRKKLMGLDDFDHVIRMIYLYERTKKPFQVLLIKHPSLSNEEINKFKLLTFFNIQEIEYKNWSGDKFKASRQTHCIRAMHEMAIMHDGKVNLCCMEYGKVIFGNVNKSTIKEIWESPYRQMYAHAHSTGKYLLGPCSNCTKA